MEAFNVKDLSFSYPNGKKALEGINLSVRQGEFICICGPSGCGKTTLLKMLKPVLSPSGEAFGEIFFFNTLLDELTQKEQASRIGYILQDVENQIVTDKVWHELAFGLESLGVKSDEIRKRVAEMASFFGIGQWFHKRTQELSGGQKQLLNLASVMVMQPDVLLLDEPTSQLDPIAAEEFLKTVHKINKELGTTVIMSEHRLEEAFSIADRVVVMDEGRLVCDETPNRAAKKLKEENSIMSMALPTPTRVYSVLSDGDEFPLTVVEGREWLNNYAEINPPDKTLIPKDKNHTGNTYIELKDVWFRYEKNAPDVLKGMNLSVKKGEIFSILGGNGSGKTTALSLISGLNSPYRGEIKIGGEKISEVKNLYTDIIGYLPQNPKLLFTKNTVRKELEQYNAEMSDYVSLLNLSRHLDCHPYDLSGGEIQRAALCKVLLKDPQVLLLDEPTKGFDSYLKSEFGKILKELQKQGKTIIIVSHDVEFCAKVSDCCSMIFDGEAVVSATPREFFCNNYFYTTAASRMSRGVLDGAATVDDIVTAFNKSVPQVKPIEADKKNTRQKVIKKEEEQKKAGKKISQWAIIALIFSLIAVPITVYIGMTALKDESYYLISLLIIFETMLPFFALYEGKKPQARELVLIAVMCAVCVAGRVVFAPFTHIKPMLALVIVSGVCLGCETGFMVGAVSCFVSNFFFGQGPWTPWQMFAFAVVGFFAGVIFSKTKKSTTTVSIYGFVSSFVLYSGIVNFSSIFLMKMPINIQSIVTIYGAGLPFDLMHAVSTTVFLVLLTKPVLEKTERIKIKYGIKL